MIDATQDSSASARETPPASAGTVQELLDSLVGIASARVVLRDDGTVQEVHVLALPDTSPDVVRQSVASAVRARFDLTVPRDRIFVARIQGDEPPAPPGPPGPADPGEVPEPGPSLLAPSEVPEAGDVGPPPWPERDLTAEPDSGTRTEISSSRRLSTKASPRLESRLLFLGHRTAKRRFKDVDVAVDLQWRGQRYRGAASVPDVAADRLQAPALATLRALDDALERRPSGDRPLEITLTLRGVELVEALGERHVMVAVLADVDGAPTPLTGSVVVDDSVELATILATLQATDRRVRAILLNHLPGNGGPPSRSRH